MVWELLLEAVALEVVKEQLEVQGLEIPLVQAVQAPLILTELIPV